VQHQRHQRRRLNPAIPSQFLGRPGSIPGFWRDVDRSGPSLAGFSICGADPKLENSVHAMEGKAATLLFKGEAREAKAKAAGRNKVAAGIANGITRVQERDAKLDARLTLGVRPGGRSAVRPPSRRARRAVRAG
jgi:hypothetical protein